MLWVASLLALVAGLPALSVAIAVVVVVNATFAFLQESRAGRAAERLRALLPMQITVWRDGRRQEIDSTAVVVDDVLSLDGGDRIPADATVQRSHVLLVDRSLLTGESEPVLIGPGGDLHAGTFVVEGEADALVTATGVHTRLAGIAAMTTSLEATSGPLAVELHRVVRTVAVIALTVGALFFAVMVALGRGLEDGAILGIGVTVALVPEALLPTVTLSLAWGAERMAERRVLVRNLEAVETLGSTTFICTDKTGTLTLNQMTVVQVWTPTASAVVERTGYDPDDPPVVSGDRTSMVTLATAAVRCSTGYVHRTGDRWQVHGDPTEAALDTFARRLGIDTDRLRARDPVARFPFDPRRRRMSTVTAEGVFVKGAPDAVLPLCADRCRSDDVVTSMVARGFRVIAVASRAIGDTHPADAGEAERDLHLLGLLAMEDPPRLEVRDALVRCRQAGIRVAMVTGDHPRTAAAIADQVGLREPDDPIHVGVDLPDDDVELGALIDCDGCVVARASPEVKWRIAAALRARGHVVAMTGDGVNDGPCLQEADVGIAMGASGTDVAREAADLVLLDDRFDTIVAGIEQGRTTFLNMRRFLTYHLTDNVAELTPLLVWAVSGGRIPLALGVLQILALDIGTDTLSAVALGAEPPSTTILGQPPVSGRLLDRTVIRRAFAVFGPIIAAGTMAAFFVSCAVAGWSPGESFPRGVALESASGAAFATVVVGQSANAFACRSSTRTPAALGWSSNRLLLPAVLLELAFSVVVLFVPAIADRLGHAGPPAAGWLVAGATASLVLVVDAIDKRLRRSRAIGAAS